MFLNNAHLSLRKMGFFALSVVGVMFAIASNANSTVLVGYGTSTNQLSIVGDSSDNRIAATTRVSGGGSAIITVTGYNGSVTFASGMSGCSKSGTSTVTIRCPYSPYVLAELSVSGGSGNDTINIRNWIGFDAVTLSGGSGSDTVSSPDANWNQLQTQTDLGDGIDVFVGGAQADAIDSNDGGPDVVNCGGFPSWISADYVRSDGFDVLSSCS